MNAIQILSTEWILKLMNYQISKSKERSKLGITWTKYERMLKDCKFGFVMPFLTNMA